jgi:hypothetical protein
MIRPMKPYSMRCGYSSHSMDAHLPSLQVNPCCIHCSRFENVSRNFSDDSSSPSRSESSVSKNSSPAMIVSLMLLSMPPTYSTTSAGEKFVLKIDQRQDSPIHRRKHPVAIEIQVDKVQIGQATERGTNGAAQSPSLHAKKLQVRQQSKLDGDGTNQIVQF